MNNENPVNQSAPAPAPKELSPVFELLANLKADGGPGVMPDVVAQLRKTARDKIVTKKAEQLATALDNFSAIVRALKSIKPKPTGYDADGRAISEAFTKEQNDERKKLKESFDKAHNALTAALQGDFGKIGEIKAPSNGKPSEAPAQDESAE